MANALPAHQYRQRRNCRCQRAIAMLPIGYTLAAVFLVAQAAPALIEPASHAYRPASASGLMRLPGHATPPPDMAVAMALREHVRPVPLSTATAPRVMPVFLHQIISSDQTQGRYNGARVQRQLHRLNALYADQGVHFTLAGWDVAAHDGWFSTCTESDSAHPSVVAMTDFFVNRPAFANGNAAGLLHVYTCDGGETRGIATYPWQFDEALGGNGEEDPRHRIAINFRTLPGGDVALWNDGGTLAHEIGHYLGLVHTFEGDDCRNGEFPRGDWSADTPAMISASYFGCPVARDTCPMDPGLDPVENLMSLSQDSCLTGITAGQRQLLHLWSGFRPTLWTQQVPCENCETEKDASQ